MADGSRPGHPTHSGKTMLQPAAVKLVLLVGAGAAVDWLIPACAVRDWHRSKDEGVSFWHMKSCDCTYCRLVVPDSYMPHFSASHRSKKGVLVSVHPNGAIVS